MEERPLEVGDAVRKTKGAVPSDRVGKIVRFSKQGEVALAWVEWADYKFLPNPSLELIENLEVRRSCA